jgi:hypothetical protein
VFICVQVDKTRANAGFLSRMDGHCQWNCQQGGGLNNNPSQSGNYSAETRLLPLDELTGSNVSIAWFQTMHHENQIHPIPARRRILYPRQRDRQAN